MKVCQRIIVFAAGFYCSWAFAPKSLAPTRRSPLLLGRHDGLTTGASTRRDNKWTVLCVTPPEKADSNAGELQQQQQQEVTCWNPQLRKTLGAIATLGVVETGYLTWTKLAADGQTFCGMDCASVLNGPYASVPGVGIPLAALGLVAYSIVAFLALGPLVQGENSNNDDDNRIWLTAVSTTMGVFSVFLMSLLFGVLKESCYFCVASAVFSISLAKLSWLGGVPPANKLKEGIQYSLGGGLTAVAGALVLFLGASEDASSSQVNYAGSLMSGGSTSTLLASAASTKDPPPILSSSSPRALQVSTDLVALDAKMYGA